MTRGRKPKPTAKKKLQGNPGRRPLPENEPVFKGTTTAPAWLDDIAKQEWRRLAPRLETLRLLTVADRAAFAIYCAQYSRMVRAEEFLQSPKAGGSEVYVTAAGALKQWPHVAIANQAARLCKEFITEFGLTPSSRARLGTEPPKKSTTGEDFLFGDGSADDECSETN